MSVSIEWSSGVSSGWQDLYQSVSQSNILQCWAYGEAKAQVEGISVRRGMITLNGTPVGLLQALERRVAGVGRIVRVNRGPLWLAPPEARPLGAVLSTLRSGARWWKCAALSIAPELPDTPESRRVLAEAGFWARRAPCWESAWIDLGLTEERLRASLSSKWRNMVVAAERSDIQISVTESDSAMQWIVAQQHQMQAARRFSAPSADLLRAFWNAEPEPRRSFVAQASREGEMIAGLLVVCHGTTATYLLGWAGEEGRRRKASNLLLWSAIQEARRRGCGWFDLGGIDAVNTPGIARFKRGVNGMEYRLVGEYVAL